MRAPTATRGVAIGGRPAVEAPAGCPDGEVKSPEVEPRRQGTNLAAPGDSVVCPPGEEHWHGAAADTFAAHLAIQESAADGSEPVTWLEPVPQETYDRAQRSPAE